MEFDGNVRPYLSGTLLALVDLLICSSFLSLAIWASLAFGLISLSYSSSHSSDSSPFDFGIFLECEIFRSIS